MSSPFAAPRAPLASVVVAVALIVSVPGLAQAATFSCTDAGVQAALAFGGAADIACATPTTIVVPATRVIAHGTVLDGNGLLTLSGGGARTVLEVPSGVTATIRRVAFENAASGANYGGALRVLGTLTMNETTIRGSSSSVGGSALWVATTGSLTMIASTVTGNSGPAGGAIAVQGSATFVNTTVSDNAGRGLVALGGSATLEHCTFVTTTEPLFSAGGGAFTVSHSILFSSGGAPSAAGPGGTLTSQGYNLIAVTEQGLPIQGDITTNLTNVTPLLGALADNGGRTLTRALLPCSPGIDAGATTIGPANDQRGQPRAVNGARDIGAFESALRPCVLVDDVTVTEGDSGTTNATVHMRLSGPSAIATQVGYSTTNLSATTADGDYAATSGGVWFEARTTTASFSIGIVGDRRFEPTETLLVAIGAPAGLDVADAEAIVTIANDDARPTITISDSSTVERDEGVTTMGFVVSLDQASSETVTVAYATLDETASVARGDYDAASGTLTFPPGTVTRTFNVPIHPDTRFESNERFGVVLSSPTNATFARARATGTITNDDAMPSLSVDSIVVTEGDTGVTDATFRVTLSNPSDAAVTVHFATESDTATAGADFVGASGELTFAPGVAARDVVVSVMGERTFEPTEAFRLVLSAPIGAAIAQGVGTATIGADDTAPVVTVADARITEGDVGSRALAFVVALDRASGAPITVPYTTNDATATALDDDYDAANGEVLFPPGSTLQTIMIPVNGDARFEGVETFTLALGTPEGATLGDASALGTIDEDDVAPDRTLSIGDVSVSEGDEGTTDAVFTVSLDAPHDAVVTVRFTTSDATATAASDYTAATGTLTFAPGETSHEVTIALTGDSLHEEDETLRVELDMASGATIDDAVGVGTILDDEANPGLAIGSATIAEGAGGTRVAEVTVTLTGASASYVTVDWATVDDTATVEDDDFAAGLGTLVFAPGVTSQTVRVVVLGDETFEADEACLVQLSNAVGAAIATAEGTVTITNDDEMATVGDAGVDGGTPTSSGSGCVVTASSASSAHGLVLVLVLALAIARKRR